jgi:GTP-binding protein
MDMLPVDERAAAAAEIVRKLRWRGSSYRISALTGEGCRELSSAIMKFLETGKTP